MASDSINLQIDPDGTMANGGGGSFLPIGLSQAIDLCKNYVATVLLLGTGLAGAFTAATAVKNGIPLGQVVSQTIENAHYGWGLAAGAVSGTVIGVGVGQLFKVAGIIFKPVTWSLKKVGGGVAAVINAATGIDLRGRQSGRRVVATATDPNFWPFTIGVLGLLVGAHMGLDGRETFQQAFAKYGSSLASYADVAADYARYGISTVKNYLPALSR
ncbi:MAG: hypothetical protein EBQ89_07910 [Alphaproteobacteria bacterium]|nr:hypothetical protein [Alphaproteobacteria bacterium]